VVKRPGGNMTPGEFITEKMKQERMLRFYTEIGKVIWYLIIFTLGVIIGGL
jgi:hypothetical protein